MPSSVAPKSSCWRSSTYTSDGSCPTSRTSRWPAGSCPEMLESDLREKVEKTEPRRAAERLAEPFRRERDVLVAQLGGHGEVGE